MKTVVWHEKASVCSLELPDGSLSRFHELANGIPSPSLKPVGESLRLLIAHKGWHWTCVSATRDGKSRSAAVCNYIVSWLAKLEKKLSERAAIEVSMHAIANCSVPWNRKGWKANRLSASALRLKRCWWNPTAPTTVSGLNTCRLNISRCRLCFLLIRCARWTLSILCVSHFVWQSSKGRA